MLLGGLSLTSSFLIEQGAIIGLNFNSAFKKSGLIKYINMTYAGVITTIIPKQLLELVKVFSKCMTAICTNRDADKVKEVAENIEKKITWLTGLSPYQIESLSYTDATAKLFYDDLLFISLQSIVTPGAENNSE